MRAAALGDILRLWHVVSVDDLSTVVPFAQAGAIVVRAGHRASSAAAARYFMAFRQAEGVPGAVSLTHATPPTPEVATAMLRGGALAGFANGRRRGLSPQAALQNGFVKASGSASNLVLDGMRSTILGAVHGDHEAKGWQRVAGGKTCDFCATLIGRGAIYKGEDTAGFQSHDHCSCSAEPVYS